MMKCEFEDLVNNSITEDEYKIIEKVYTFYPCISNTKGKAQVKYLYDNFGIQIFRDMFTTAETCENYDIKLRKAKAQVEEIEKEYSNYISVVMK